jgi:hypothetical protein
VASKSLLDLAKFILQPIECDWGDCASVMNSWNSLLKVSKTSSSFRNHPSKLIAAPANTLQGVACQGDNICIVSSVHVTAN